MSNFMGLDGFFWFTGVVEDRNDPDQIGRVRVRCLGVHTEDQSSIPTSDLPWAHVMHPVTDPSMHGMGSSPTFLVEGSWVVGFFRDGKSAQQPVVMGTLPGVPLEHANFREGFNDPRHKESSQLNDAGKKQYAYNPATKLEYGPYPLGSPQDTAVDPPVPFTRDSGHTFGETDTNRLARGSVSETHKALIKRRKIKRTKVPIATKPFIPSVENLSVNGTSAAETRGTWDELDPKGLTSTASPYTSAKYPLNHVTESESGHIHEIDDTPAGERLMTQHRSGTFEEIHPDGSKVVKVVGDNYEIIAGHSNVLITGAVNLTVEGNVRELIKGDYVLEVEGDYTQKIHKNHRVKVGAGSSGGNREEEIRGSHSYNINQNIQGRVGGHRRITVEQEDILNVNDFQDTSVVNNIFTTSLSGQIDTTAYTNMTVSTITGDMSLRSGLKTNIKSATNMTIKTEAALISNSTSTWTHTSGGDITITGGPNIKLNPS